MIVPNRAHTPRYPAEIFTDVRQYPRSTVRRSSYCPIRACTRGSSGKTRHRTTTTTTTPGPLSASTHSKPNGDGNKQITPFLAQILQLFDDPSAAGVNDWSTSDGISFKVLGPYVAAHPHPRRAARYLLAWATRAAPGTRAARSFSHHHSKDVSIVVDRQPVLASSRARRVLELRRRQGRMRVQLVRSHRRGTGTDA